KPLQNPAWGPQIQRGLSPCEVTEPRQHGRTHRRRYPSPATFPSPGSDRRLRGSAKGKLREGIQWTIWLLSRSDCPEDDRSSNYDARDGGSGLRRSSSPFGRGGSHRSPLRSYPTVQRLGMCHIQGPELCNEVRGSPRTTAGRPL